MMWIMHALVTTGRRVFSMPTLLVRGLTLPATPIGVSHLSLQSISLNILYLKFYSIFLRISFVKYRQLTLTKPIFKENCNRKMSFNTHFFGLIVSKLGQTKYYDIGGRLSP